MTFNNYNKRKYNMKNKDMGRKGIPLNLNEAETKHTNPDGKTIKIKKIGDEYFSKRTKKGKVKTIGSSWLFPNHLEYNGWLALNGFVSIDVEELEEWV